MRATDGAGARAGCGGAGGGEGGREDASGGTAGRRRWRSRIRNYFAIKKRLFCIDEDAESRHATPRRAASRRAAPRVTKNLRPNNILTSLVIRFPRPDLSPLFRPREPDLAARARGKRYFAYSPHPSAPAPRRLLLIPPSRRLAAARVTVAARRKGEEYYPARYVT